MKKYFLTFANESYKIQGARIIKQAKDTEWFDECILETPITISSFIEQHKSFFENNHRGFGCWIWKPYIILKCLYQIDEGSMLVYQDAGGSVIKSKTERFKDYCRLLEDSPVIAFSVKAYKEKYFQKMDLLKKFNLHTNDEFLESANIETGVIIIKKSKSTVDFFQNWLDIMIEQDYYWSLPNSIHQNHPEFIQYRDDQSVFSILYKMNSWIDFDTESYGIGPFFSSRLSDSNLKADAPDKFRIRNDYDVYKHKDYFSYQSDTGVRANLENEVKDFLISMTKVLKFDSTEVDLKSQFLDVIITFLDKLSYDFGLLSYKLMLDEDAPYTLIGRQILTGKIVLDIPAGFTSDLIFEINANNVVFHPTEIDRTNLFSKITIHKVRVI